MIINAIKMDKKEFQAQIEIGLNLLNEGAKIQGMLEENSRAIYNSFIPVFGMAPDYKRGAGKPDVTGFCKKVWNTVPPEQRPVSDKGKEVPYSTASAHLKHPLANRVRSLEKWIVANSADLFSVKTALVDETGKPVVDEKTGEAVTETTFLFESVAMAEAEKRAKRILDAIATLATLNPDECPEDEKEKVMAILADVSKRVALTKDALESERKAVLAAKAAEQAAETETAPVEEATTMVSNG